MMNSRTMKRFLIIDRMCEPQKSAAIMPSRTLAGKRYETTAQLRKVVAFRTYVRTRLHELNHHLDIDLLELEDSFHAEGFYKRKSSLFKQLTQGTGL